MRRFFCALLCSLCIFSLFGCSLERENNALYTIPDDVSDVKDFKCVCSTDYKTEFIIESDDAKELYFYIRKQWKNAEQTEIDRTEQDYIYLLFQDGEPLLTLSQESKAESSDVLSVSEKHFYGVFWISENDYMIYTAMPTTSFQEYYKLPEGTYNSVFEMVTQ